MLSIPSTLKTIETTIVPHTEIQRALSPTIVMVVVAIFAFAGTAVYLLRIRH